MHTNNVKKPDNQNSFKLVINRSQLPSELDFSYLMQCVSNYNSQQDSIGISVVVGIKSSFWQGRYSDTHHQGVLTGTYIYCLCHIHRHSLNREYRSQIYKLLTSRLSRVCSAGGESCTQSSENMSMVALYFKGFMREHY